MSDLTTFLLARIAEDEHDHKHRVGRDWHMFDCDATTWNGDHFGTCDCTVPARVLAECEAKRQIVEDAAACMALPLDDPTCDGFARFTLAHLALPYASHPDYREEWRPC